MTEFWAVVSLFWSSFLSATLLPGGSEVVLVSLLVGSFAPPWMLLVIASVGNTLGGITNVVIGRLLPGIKPQRGVNTARRWLLRYGTPALLFSWVPVIGDVLCVLAGWFRMPWTSAILFILIGKVLRYLLVAGLTLKWGMG